MNNLQDTKELKTINQDEQKFIDENGELGKAMLDCYDLELAQDALENHYYGEYLNEEDFAQYWMKERADTLLLDGSPEHEILSQWCNWEQVIYVLSDDFNFINANDKTHVFSRFDTF